MPRQHIHPQRIIRNLFLFSFILAWLGAPAFVLAASSYDLVIHYVTATPIEGQAAYDVGVYFSVLDEEDLPVNDLEAEDFTLMEDSKTVEIQTLDIVRDEPNHIVLVMDASGSMLGDNMDAAKDAAAEFVQALERDDRIAVISFTRETITEIDFTDNREDARSAVENIEALRNSDTCLYDAVYDALQMLAPEPAGRRAVILLTDGVDETSDGASCSVHTMDDVTNLATTGGTRTPIYTIGLTGGSDERNLERISVLTGGRYRLAPDRTFLEEAFDALTDQFRSEYILHYTSTSASGVYQLLLEVDHRDRSDQDTREFVLPELPVAVYINAPQAGAELSGAYAIEANATGQNQIKDLVFRINGTEVGAVGAAPYRLEYDFSLLEPGEYTLTVAARDFNNNELAQQSIDFTAVAAAQPAPQDTEEAEPTEAVLSSAEPEADEGLPRSTILLIGLGLLGLLVVVVVVAVVAILLSRRRKEAEREPAPQAPLDDRTVDSYPRQPPMAQYGVQPVGGPLAVLRVISSEDPMMVGKAINLTKKCTTIGRGADNDIVLPSDKAVSRRHALIELTGNDFFLSEYVTQEAGGGVKRPTYGTFVNEQKSGPLPVLLKSGDEIQLGTRFKMQFEKIESAFKSRRDADKTLDEMDGEDKTLIM